MAKLGSGGRPPLFDRLVTPREGVPPSTQDLAEIRVSIQYSLDLLVSSRAARPIQEYLSAPLTTLDWGIPDFTSLSPSTESDRRLMAKVLERAITCFEPRLSQVLVRPLPPSGTSGSLARFEVQATLALSQLQERLTFSVGVSRAQ
jgi:type VI secretion system protein ImpF